MFEDVKLVIDGKEVRTNCFSKEQLEEINNLIILRNQEMLKGVQDNFNKQQEEIMKKYIKQIGRNCKC